MSAYGYDRTSSGPLINVRFTPNCGRSSEKSARMSAYRPEPDMRDKAVECPVMTQLGPRCLSKPRSRYRRSALLPLAFGTTLLTTTAPRFPEGFA